MLCECRYQACIAVAHRTTQPDMESFLRDLEIDHKSCRHLHLTWFLRNFNVTHGHTLENGEDKWKSSVGQKLPTQVRICAAGRTRVSSP